MLIRSICFVSQPIVVDRQFTALYIDDTTSKISNFVIDASILTEKNKKEKKEEAGEEWRGKEDPVIPLIANWTQSPCGRLPRLALVVVTEHDRSRCSFVFFLLSPLSHLVQRRRWDFIAPVTWHNERALSVKAKALSLCPPQLLMYFYIHPWNFHYSIHITGRHWTIVIWRSMRFEGTRYL